MRPRTLIPLLGALAAGAAGWLYLTGFHHAARRPAMPASVQSRLVGTQETGAAGNPLQALASALDPLRGEANRWQLAQLLGHLRALPRVAAARQLVEFLQSGKDARTGVRMRVGRGGWLETAPTLRVAALDWLAEFDPAAAHDYAREIFATTDSADEWAIALRNYYWSTRSVDAYFVARVAEAFSRENWVRNPSTGLAESVDFPVVIGGSDGYGILTALMQKSARLRFPALAAMDAWVVDQRRDAVTLLAAQATADGVLDAASRAALLARADVRDPAQKAAIQSYLGNTGVPLEAKAEFLRQFPNQSMIMGNHLVTAIRPAPFQDSARQDVAALRFVDDLIAAGTCPELGQQLAATRERLAGYVESARRGGQL